MRRVKRMLKWRASAVTGLIAVLALVSLPVEVTIGLIEHPVVPPGRLASLLLIGSCLLLVGSGLGLRREEAARAGARRSTPSA
ncbi:MAG TPA: hypothetical protein VFX87_16270 [Methylomirabilota bacterium]|nr:hypothetical protein [Methylomirabilota bacterium]